jgi:hypothetical protein
MDIVNHYQICTDAAALYNNNDNCEIQTDALIAAPSRDNKHDPAVQTGKYDRKAMRFDWNDRCS